MVLSRQFWTGKISDMRENPHNYMVINTTQYAYHNDVKRLERGVDIINLCNAFYIINDAYKKSGIKKEFNFNILYEVLGAIYSNQIFTLNQLKALYLFQKEMDDIGVAMQSFSPTITEGLFLDSEVELFLLGISFKRQEELKMNDTDLFPEVLERMHEKCEMVFKKELTVEKLQAEVIETFNQYYKEAEEKKNKVA